MLSEEYKSYPKDGTMQLESFFSVIPDHRRPQGRRYSLGYLLLFTILAILSGASSYRTIQRFIETHREQLNALCGLRWKRAPAYHSIRYALHGFNPEEVGAAFRQSTATLPAPASGQVRIALNSKVLRSRLNHFQDRKAVQVLSALASESTLVLAQVLVTDADKASQIAAVQRLIKGLGLSVRLFALQTSSTQQGGSAPIADP
jgi:hypothetical protein